MALLHQAELRPSKLELLDGWVHTRPWFDGASDAALSTVAAFRFDDPAGEVGVETLLIRAGDGPTLQIPLTYRGSPLLGADAFLIGTMEHSVLGARWVYDGVGDPVYLQTVAAAALNGGHQAELFIDIDGKRVERTPTALVTGTGTARDSVILPALSDLAVHQDGAVTVVDMSAMQVGVRRVVGGGAISISGPSAEPYRAAETLTGTWDGAAEPQPLVIVRHNRAH